MHAGVFATGIVTFASCVSFCLGLSADSLPERARLHNGINAYAGVQIIFYLLYGNMQVAFAFLLSCFFSSDRTANVCCYIWLVGAGLFAGNLMDSVFAADRWWATLLQLVPTFGAYR
jgi:hypothetical protein